MSNYKYEKKQNGFICYSYVINRPNDYLFNLIDNIDICYWASRMPKQMFRQSNTIIEYIDDSMMMTC